MDIFVSAKAAVAEFTWKIISMKLTTGDVKNVEKMELKMKINPCPFCRSIPWIFSGIAVSYVECRGCEAKGPVEYHDGSSLGQARAERLAIEKWDKASIQKPIQPRSLYA